MDASLQHAREMIREIPDYPLPGIRFQDVTPLLADVLQIHQDALEVGSKVLLIDDVPATGGTAIAACKLIERLGSTIQRTAFVIEIVEPQGRGILRESYPDMSITSLFAL